MPTPLVINLHEGDLVVASGVGVAVDLWGTDSVETRRATALTLVVFEATGACSVHVETSRDGTTWQRINTSAAGASGVTELLLGDMQRYARASWTIPALGSARFALSGKALELWCSLTELSTLGSAAAALSALPVATRLRHLLAATTVAAGYIARRNSAPILRVGQDVVQAVAKLASVSLLTDAHGVNPHTEAAALVFEEARGKERWLRDVSNGLAVADVTDSTPTAHEGSGAAAVSGPPRGWGSMSIV